MRKTRTSTHLRRIVVAAVCVLVTPALLLTSCDNLFGSDSAADPSVPEMPVAALVGTMGTLSATIAAAEGKPDVPETISADWEDDICNVSFENHKPFGGNIIFRTVNLSEDTALTGEVTVAFPDGGTTITVNGTIDADDYSVSTLTFSNVVLTFESGKDEPDTVSGTVTVDGTTWQMDHVYRVFLSGVYSSHILNLNALDNPSDGGLIALFVSSYENYSPGMTPPDGVQVLEWDEGDTANMLHLQFTNFDPTDGDGEDDGSSTSITGTQRGIVNTTDGSEWLSELRADLSAELLDDEGDEFTVVLRDAVLRLPQDWETPSAWSNITWDGQFGVNGVFFRLDYLLDVMHVLGAMGMLGDGGDNGNGIE